jgi:predicted nucleotidyltransferase
MGHASSSAARGGVLAVLLRTGEPMTGRQIHHLVSDDYSLWSVQEAMKALTRLGLVDSHTIGRAGVHTINDCHAFVAPLRALVDPIAALKAAIGEVLDGEVRAVILFGSIARGDPDLDSGIDLAVIAAPGWDRRVELQDTVRTRLGNDRDVLLFTEAEFRRRAAEAEPVAVDILGDGVALVGTKPRVRTGAA